MPTEHIAADPGIYRRYQPHAATTGLAGVFLDRDGVLVEETGYLHKPEDIVFIPGSTLAVARLNKAGIPVILVTNQAGVGRGYYTWYEFEVVQAAIESELAKAGARLDAVLACAYHPDGRDPFARDHPFRKPNPGMVLDAQSTLNLTLEQSWIIGDKSLDLEAGRNAGVGHLVLVRTGYGKQHENRLAPGPNVHVVETLEEAVDSLILAGSRV